MVVEAWSLMEKEIKEHNKQWWTSAFRFVTSQVDARSKTTSENRKKKSEKNCPRDKKTLGVRDEPSVKVLDNIELPGWVHKTMPMGLKQSIRDKFNETHFLAHIDIFLSQLKNKKASGETLCEIEATAKA